MTNYVNTRPKRAGWVVSGLLLVVLAASFLMGSFYVVDTGHVGVERTLGKVDLNETRPGMNFKMPFLTSAYEFSAKEIALDLDDLKRKRLTTCPFRTWTSPFTTTLRHMRLRT